MPLTDAGVCSLTYRSSWCDAEDWEHEAEVVAAEIKRLQDADISKSIAVLTTSVKYASARAAKQHLPVLLHSSCKAQA